MKSILVLTPRKCIECPPNPPQRLTAILQDNVTDSYNISSRPATALTQNARKVYSAIASTTLLFKRDPKPIYSTTPAPKVSFILRDKLDSIPFSQSNHYSLALFRYQQLRTPSPIPIR